ncbi:MAG: tRNA (N6-threonylcarbamoyladenosine(37)-N6)-methyltransferase TrmO [Haloferacaceae archaeon]
MDEDVGPIEYEPIGAVRSPHDSLEGMPIQPAGARGTRGRIELDEEYADALSDLDGFSHCYVLYHFHGSDGDAPATVEPFLDSTERGLFSTRAPRRPNAIGLSVVRVEAVDGATVEIRDVDVLDGTPVLDVKPFVPDFDVPEDPVAGWVDRANDDPQKRRADDRFL